MAAELPRALLAFAILLPMAVAAVAADARYLPVLRILNAQGSLDTNVIGGPYPGGISRTECDLRLERWLSEFGPTMEAAKEMMRKEGKFSSYRTECIRAP